MHAQAISYEEQVLLEYFRQPLKTTVKSCPGHFKLRGQPQHPTNSKYFNNLLLQQPTHKRCNTSIKILSTCDTGATSSSLLLLWVWNRTGPCSWCGRRSGAAGGGRKASSSWQRTRTDNSPHWHRSAGAGVGLPGRLSPGPAVHPKQGQVPLREVRWEVMLGL